MKNEIEIPENVEITIEGNKLIARGKEGENSREFNLGKINFEKKDKKIILSCEKATKKEKRIINTSIAHIKNMVQGVQKKFEYKLKICSSHFPMTVKFEGNTAIIKNFLGEKVDRKVELPKNAEIKMEKEIITIISIDKELAGQAAANLEKATKIRGRDKRVFQDGIYIINKAGREI
ncbi:50S ribosomal protein L6 [Candidatus Pacearchaeota archaeon]|nr:50S ribosomal protein L6 [Candidatus Pacearchaeota archaeon]MBI2057014.1 50S ribosomal protein L6 [Candidatus Pacearchaeota archaeon]